MMSLSDNKPADIKGTLNTSSRHLDIIYYDNMISQIYQA